MKKLYTQGKQQMNADVRVWRTLHQCLAVSAIIFLVSLNCGCPKGSYIPSTAKGKQPASLSESMSKITLEPAEIKLGPVFISPNILVYLGSDQKLYGRDLAGTISWHLEVGSLASRSFELRDSKLLLLTQDTRLIEVDPLSGQADQRTLAVSTVSALEANDAGSYLYGFDEPSQAILIVDPHDAIIHTVPLDFSEAVVLPSLITDFPLILSLSGDDEWHLLQICETGICTDVVTPLKAKLPVDVTPFDDDYLVSDSASVSLLNREGDVLWTYEAKLAGTTLDNDNCYLLETWGALTKLDVNGAKVWTSRVAMEAEEDLFLFGEESLITLADTELVVIKQATGKIAEKLTVGKILPGTFKDFGFGFMGYMYDDNKVLLIRGPGLIEHDSK